MHSFNILYFKNLKYKISLKKWDLEYIYKVKNRKKKKRNLKTENK